MIKTISVTNFMNISNATINFNSGVNALLGEVGQGKSAILEAISYCLLGKTKGSSWKDYIKSGTKGFTIHLEVLEPQGESVQFDYSGVSGKGSVVKDITYKSDHYYGEDANNLVSRLFDTETLDNIVFNMQNRKSLSSVKPAESRALFKKVFNTDFPDIIETIKGDKTIKVDQTNLMVNQISILQGKIYPFFRIAEVDDSSLPQLQSELQKSQESELTKQKYLLYVEKVNNLKKLQNDLSITIKEKLDKEQLLITNSTKVDTIDKSIVIKEAELVTKQALIEELTIALDTSKTEYTAYLESFDPKASNEELKRLIEAKNDCTVKIKILEKHIEVHSKGLCESCGQECPITKIPEMEAAKALLVQEASDFNNSISELSIRIEDYSKKKQEYTDTINKVINQLDKMKSELLAIKKEIETLNGTKTLIQTDLINSITDTISNLSIKIDTMNLKITSATQEVADSVVIQDTESTRQVQEIQKEINEILSQIQANIEQEKVNDQLRVQRTKDQDSLKILNDEYNTQLQEIADIDTIIKIFEIDFPSYLNLRAGTLLQSYMNNFFERVKSGFKVFLDIDKKGIVFKYKAHSEPDWISIDMASGFESAMLTLGFNCSIAMAYHQPMIILDEPDKDASQVASERLMETILGLDLFKQIILISHNPACKEVLITNGSTIYEVSDGVFIKTY